jgi:hypothetical protein
MHAAWTVGVHIRTFTNVGGFSQLTKGATLANERVETLNKSMGSLRGSITSGLGYVGIAAAATFAIGIKGAMAMQESTVQAAIAMSKMGTTIDKTMNNMKSLRDVALEMSKITGQSLPDSMGVISTMASAGITEKQIKSDWKPIAQFTDVLHFSKKDSMDYGDAAKLGAGLAHEFRMY